MDLKSARPLCCFMRWRRASAPGSTGSELVEYWKASHADSPRLDDNNASGQERAPNIGEVGEDELGLACWPALRAVSKEKDGRRPLSRGCDQRPKSVSAETTMRSSCRARYPTPLRARCRLSGATGALVPGWAT